MACRYHLVHSVHASGIFWFNRISSGPWGPPARAEDPNGDAQTGSWVAGLGSVRPGRLPEKISMHFQSIG